LALALDGEGEQLAVACSRTSEVLVFGLGSPDKPPLRLATRPHPCALLFSPDGQLLVVAEDGGEAASLAVFKLPEGRFYRRVSCLAHPRSMAWAEDQAKLYLCAGDEGLAVLRAGDFRLEKVIKAGGRPQQLCLPGAGAWAYLSSQQADSLSCIKLADRSLHAAVQTAPVPRGLALSPDGAFAWVACEGLEPETPSAEIDWGALSVVRLQDLVATDRLPAAGGALALAFSKSGGAVFCIAGRTGFFDVFASASHAHLKRLFLGRQPSAMAYDASRGRCYVAQRDAAAVAVVDVSEFP
jgi:DNA-binding beta-propeller fold protein YncE